MGNDYFNIPVEMIKELYGDGKAAITRMYNYGVFNFAKQMDLDISDASRNTLYDYCKHPDSLPSDLREYMEEVNDSGQLEIDPDHGDCFNASGELDDILFETFNDMVTCNPGLRGLVDDYGRFKAAKNFFQQDFSYRQCRKIYDSITNKTPYASISRATLWSYYDRFNKHEDFCTLALLLAIRSIVGAKSMVRTNKKMVVARSLGFNTPHDLDERLKSSKKLKELYDEVSSRRQFDKRFMKLEIAEMVAKIHLPGEHWVYLSTKGRDTLVDEVKKFKGEDKESQLHRWHDKAVKEILTAINKRTA